MIEEARRAGQRGKVDALGLDRLAAKVELAGEQRLTGRGIAGEWILRHGKQLERKAPTQAEAVEWGLPGDSRQPARQPFGQRRSPRAVEPNQPLALLDPILVTGTQLCRH
jgi:hypothetical protein